MMLQRNSTKTALCSFRTWPASPCTLQWTKSLHMLMSTLTVSQATWESDGKSPNQSHSGRRSFILASDGTCDHESCTYLMKRKPGTLQSLPNGRRSAHTISLKHRDYTESYCMRHWSSLQDKLTSLAWRPCSPCSITVLSAYIPLPEAPPTILTGGNTNFIGLSSLFRYAAHNPSQTTKPTPTPALASAW